MLESAQSPAQGIYDSCTEKGKFHIGDELVICSGAMHFGLLIEEHMGEEAATYYRCLLSDLIEKARWENDA